jgi:hypothetical protein
MKKQAFFLVVFTLISLLSCQSEEIVSPESNFVKATVNGVKTVYTIVPQQGYNYIRPGAIEITFIKSAESHQYWTISIYHGYVALDIDDLPLPFTIKGPNEDFTGHSPEAHVNIVDNDGAPYGLPIAGASTFSNDFTVTINSVKNGVVQGIFEGTGFGKFEKGEFSVHLTRTDW